ncbi:MAG: hypothetical protein UT32_C0011G0007 [Parcubacteria group bacterium GW2011_GWC2_39_14]|nr:MAG: hypothetical protein UT32_C0011G0007 [Parcubacteria group bacterium GW2011_GWC2_39_14]KKR55045.1 MAG: hypothetical protein UT91_C0005G0046 [Parcubacteria group bacterium GW2011_GWA2_40_23]
MTTRALFTSAEHDELNSQVSVKTCRDRKGQYGP